MRVKIISASLLLAAICTQATFAFTLEEATILSIHESLQKHELTCVQLVNAYLGRIKQYNLSTDKQAPINAFTEINASALSDAAMIDDNFNQSGKLTGPLHCIPVILKDNIDSYDTTTTAGSYALLGSQPVKDAELVSRLRNAGAIILGKGGMDEFAWGMHGVSSRNGRIGNVYDTAKNPGGSSGGTAAAVSANFAAVGIGTDNSGSVRIPAVFNGLVALRPTAGLISQQGIFPMGNLDGTAGPIARTTTDLAIMMDTLSTHKGKNYTSFLSKDGLKGKRIGVVHLVGRVDTFGKISNEVKAKLNQALAVMQQLGAIIVNIDLPNFDNDRKDNQAGEIEDINNYLSKFPSTRKSFKDICESGRTRNFGDVKACLKFMKSIPAHSSQKYKNVLALIKKNNDYVQSILTRQHLDALLIPLNTQTNGSYDSSGINTWRAPVSSNAGLPAIDFIIGYDSENIPVGIDVVGANDSEGMLIEMAFAYETATHIRRRPIMPEPAEKLLSLSIAQYNNLISMIGKTTYDQILKHAGSNINLADVLTPEKFTGIVRSVKDSYLR